MTVTYHVSKQICVEPRTSALNMTLPAVELWPVADILRYLLPAHELQQTSCTSLLLSIDGTHRQTDGHRAVT